MLRLSIVENIGTSGCFRPLFHFYEGGSAICPAGGSGSAFDFILVICRYSAFRNRFRYSAQFGESVSSGQK